MPVWATRAQILTGEINLSPAWLSLGFFSWPPCLSIIAASGRCGARVLTPQHLHGGRGGFIHGALQAGWNVPVIPTKDNGNLSPLLHLPKLRELPSAELLSVVFGLPCSEECALTERRVPGSKMIHE